MTEPTHQVCGLSVQLGSVVAVLPRRSPRHEVGDQGFAETEMTLELRTVTEQQPVVPQRHFDRVLTHETDDRAFCGR